MCFLLPSLEFFFFLQKMTWVQCTGALATFKVVILRSVHVCQSRQSCFLLVHLRPCAPVVKIRIIYCCRKRLSCFPCCLCVRLVWAGPEEYHFVNQGDCFELRQVEDEDEFEKTKNALSVRTFIAADAYRVPGLDAHSKTIALLMTENFTQ